MSYVESKVNGLNVTEDVINEMINTRTFRDEIFYNSSYSTNHINCIKHLIENGLNVWDILDCSLDINLVYRLTYLIENGYNVHDVHINKNYSNSYKLLVSYMIEYGINPNHIKAFLYGDNLINLIIQEIINGYYIEEYMQVTRWHKYETFYDIVRIRDYGYDMRGYLFCDLTFNELMRLAPNTNIYTPELMTYIMYVRELNDNKYREELFNWIDLSLDISPYVDVHTDPDKLAIVRKCLVNNINHKDLTNRDTSLTKLKFIYMTKGTI